MISGFSGENLKWLAYVTIRLQPTVRLKLCRLIRAKYSSLCTHHIWGNCNCYDWLVYRRRSSAFRLIEPTGFSSTVLLAILSELLPSGKGIVQFYAAFTGTSVLKLALAPHQYVYLNYILNSKRTKLAIRKKHSRKWRNFATRARFNPNKALWTNSITVRLSRQLNSRIS